MPPSLLEKYTGYLALITVIISTILFIGAVIVFVIGAINSSTIAFFAGFILGIYIVRYACVIVSENTDWGAKIFTILNLLNISILISLISFIWGILRVINPSGESNWIEYAQVALGFGTLLFGIYSLTAWIDWSDRQIFCPAFSIFLENLAGWIAALNIGYYLLIIIYIKLGIIK